MLPVAEHYMPEVFTQISAFTVFLAIAAVGFLFLLISLAFGEVFGHFEHDGFDHDVGGPSFLSTRIISVFVTAFGGFGAIGAHYGLSTIASSAVGFASGVVFASIIYGVARFLYGQQASSDLRISDLAGQVARVVVRIPAEGVGQVRCQVGEQLVDMIARSADHQPVNENEIVRVEQVLGDTVIVRRQ